MSSRVKTYNEFYQLFLAEHSKAGTRFFHFLGTLIILSALIFVMYSGKERFLWYIPIFGFGIAWLSHAVFEKCTPATCRYPLWTLISDFRLFFELLTGKQKFKTDKKHITQKI